MIKLGPRKFLLAEASVVMLLAVGGCRQLPDPCVPGGEAGKAYVAHLDEVYDSMVTDVLFDPTYSGSGKSCGALDQLVAGGALPFTVASAKNQLAEVCFVHDAVVALPTSVQIDGDSSGLPGSAVSDVAVFHKTVRIGSCAGRMEIHFQSASTDPHTFAPATPKMPDRRPPFVVVRVFSTADAAACPSLNGTPGSVTCGDTWVATLEKQ
ncbi:MAG: hypothetical protein ABJA82_07580 [Myxococcales bacterium]